MLLGIGQKGFVEGGSRRIISILAIYRPKTLKIFKYLKKFSQVVLTHIIGRLNSIGECDHF